MYGFGSWGSSAVYPGFSSPLMFPFLLLMIWSMFWKGLALWHASRKKEPIWFIALFIINSGGILELIYLFGVAKIKFDELFKVK